MGFITDPLPKCCSVIKHTSRRRWRENGKTRVSACYKQRPSTGPALFVQGRGWALTDVRIGILGCVRAKTAYSYE